MKNVAIIGMGISGNGVFKAYLKEQLSDISLDCFDSKESFARGYPYRKDAQEALLNVRPHIIAYDHDKPREFEKWLEQKPEYQGEEYVPRYVYGDFLHEKVMSDQASSQAHFIFDQVEDMEYLEETKQWKVWVAGQSKIYDRVHLCCGELPSADYYQLKGKDKYIHDVYPLQDTLKAISKDETVGIIGTSLTAIDIIRYLLNHGHQNIYIFSRTNSFPTVRQKRMKADLKIFTVEKIREIKSVQQGFISFEQFEDLLLAEYQAYGIDLKVLMAKYNQQFAAITQSIDEDQELRFAQSLDIAYAFNEAWYGMTIADKNRMKETYSAYLRLFFSPIPLDTGIQLTEAEKNGSLQIVEGVTDIKHDQSKKLFYLLDDDKQVLAKSDWLINATGQDLSLSSLEENSLLGRLAQKEIIQPSSYGGVNAHIKGFNVLSSRYGELENLHVHGVLARGIELINNGAIMIQKSAHQRLKEILNSNKN